VLHLIGAAAFNDLYSGPSNGTANAIIGQLSVLLSDGAEPSRMEIAAGTSLKIEPRFFGSVPIAKFGTGMLTLDSTSNNLTGGFLVNAGTLGLSDRSATNGLRSNPLHLAGGATFSALTGGAVRVGTLTGSGAVSISNLSLYITGFGSAKLEPDSLSGTYFSSGPLFSGTITAGGLNISGAGGRRVTLPGNSEFSIQTFSGALTTGTGSLTVNAGAALTLFSGTGISGGVLGANAVNLRGGALVVDSSKGSGGSSFGRISNTATVNFQSGSLVLVGSMLGVDESIGSLKLNSGASTVAAVQPGSAVTKLTFGLLTRDTTSRGTVDFRGIGGTLGSSSGPQIFFGGFSGSMEPWATVNGRDYATYPSSFGVGIATYMQLPSMVTGTGSGSTYYTTTQSSVLTGSSNFAAKGIRFVPSADNLTFDIAGSADLLPWGLLLVGERDFGITASGTGGIAGANPRYIGVIEPTATLRISAPIESPGVDVVKFGHGTLDLTGNNSALVSTSPTVFVINSGILRARVSGPQPSIPLASTAIALRGGVLEISGGTGGAGTTADFRSALGLGAGKVNWSGGDLSTDEGSGGFSAFGSDATVNLGGLATPSTIPWQQSNFVHVGHALIFGSSHSNARLTFQNSLPLDDGAETNPYVAREIRVYGNADPLVRTDVARISGAISGSGNADLLKTGNGTLELTGINTLTGNVLVQEGVLQLGASGGTGEGANSILGSTSKIIVRARLEHSGTNITVADRAVLRLGGDTLTSSRVNDSATIVLEGGAIETEGLSESFGPLIVSHADAILDLGHGASLLQFASVADHFWSGRLLVLNWSGKLDGGGIDQVSFGTNGFSIRSDQLRGMSFFADGGATFLGYGMQLPSGEIVPVPEASPALAIIGGVVFLATRRRRLRW
jgi:autotransporter-associated beta strand protein